MSIHSTDPTTVLPSVRVQVAIDAAVVANHHVCVREILGDTVVVGEGPGSPPFSAERRGS